MTGNLDEWLAGQGVTLDSALSLRAGGPGGTGYSVWAARAVAGGTVVAQIPKRAVLSHRTSSLAPEALARLPGSTPDAFRLAVCVLHELLLGDHSRWATYLAHCPAQTVPIAILWNVAGEARRITRGTELEAELRRIGINEAALATFFTGTALPTCFTPAFKPQHPAYITPPTLPSFLHAYSLVSSRAFQVDTFHRLALVPLADLFNHSHPNHVHLASDHFVCPECGSLHECEHDEGDGQRREAGRADPGEGEEDDGCEMVASAGVEEGEEVFNTYGELGNAQLLAYYGFMLEANELDRMTVTLDAVGLDDGQRRMWAEWHSSPLLGDIAAEVDLDGLIGVMGDGDTVRTFEATGRDHRALCIDAEANLSWSLFLALVVADIEPTPLPQWPAADSGSDAAVAAVRATATLWQNCAQEFEDGPVASERAEVGDTTPADARVVGRVARRARALVDGRTARQHRPELSGAEALELAEEEGGGGEESERLALEFLASERLVLECVAAKWSQLEDYCDEQLARGGGTM